MCYTAIWLFSVNSEDGFQTWGCLFVWHVIVHVYKYSANLGVSVSRVWTLYYKNIASTVLQFKRYFY